DRRRRRRGRVRKTQPRDEVGHLGPPQREGLRPRVDVDPAHARVLDQAAHPVARLEDEGAQAGGGESVGGGEAPHARADDDGVTHHRLWASSTIRVSTPGSVVGGTPWPRLSTWAGAWRPRSTTSR